MISRIVSIIVVLAVVIASVITITKSRSGEHANDTPERNIKFSHKFHIQQAGAECATCHANVLESKSLTDVLTPDKQVCATCHDVSDLNQCLTCHVDGENPKGWTKTKKTLLFPHASHATAQKLSCQSCHNGVEEVDYATKKNHPSMSTCTTCHNSFDQVAACEACHTNFTNLVPENHKRSSFLRDHRDEVRLGAMDVECKTCHSEATFCQQCHAGAGLRTFGKRDQFGDPTPATSPRDTQKKLTLQSTHDLNYRFTHGIDAKSRQSDCATCHSPQQFCASCHNAGGNINQARFKPATHMVPGFATFGAGSGGGLHAQEARRDLESCISCHDAEGRDPSCMTCHTASGKVR